MVWIHSEYLYYWMYLLWWCGDTMGYHGYHYKGQEGTYIGIMICMDQVMSQISSCGQILHPTDPDQILLLSDPFNGVY